MSHHQRSRLDPVRRRRSGCVVDADVTVAPCGPGGLDATAAGQRSVQPRPADLDCGCLVEWLVQPIVRVAAGSWAFRSIAPTTRDPSAFAAGPFMLFRRCSYEAIGGHRALAAEVVEDLALARAIKGRGSGCVTCSASIGWRCACTRISPPSGKAGPRIGTWGWTAMGRSPWPVAPWRSLCSAGPGCCWRWPGSCR